MPAVQSLKTSLLNLDRPWSTNPALQIAHPKVISLTVPLRRAYNRTTSIKQLYLDCFISFEGTGVDCKTLGALSITYDSNWLAAWRGSRVVESDKSKIVECAYRNRC